MVDEVLLGDRERSLEDALRDPADDAQTHGPPVVVVDLDVVPEAELENPLERVEVPHRRNDRCATVGGFEILLEQKPRVLLLGVRLGERSREPKAAALADALRKTEQTRLLRPVEVETARLVAGAEPQRVELRLRRQEQRGGPRAERVRLATLLGLESSR